MSVSSRERKRDVGVRLRCIFDGKRKLVLIDGRKGHTHLRLPDKNHADRAFVIKRVRYDRFVLECRPVLAHHYAVVLAIRMTQAEAPSRTEKIALGE